MTLKLMFITNNENVAKMAENNGVDWIFIDLEINGKQERQGHLDTVISQHSIDDVRKIKKVLKRAKLIVRVNPIYQDSKIEVDRVIKYGSDIVMLPFFKNKSEIEDFIKYVNGRARVCLLLETSEAVNNIDSILKVQGIDYIHIGLNDLHLSYQMKFMFELLADGTVEMLCKKIKEKNIPYGFGGISKLGNGTLPAENIITEHYRLKSSMVILSRSFCNVEKIGDINKIDEIFRTGVKEIRSFEKKIANESIDYFEANREFVKKKVEEIVKSI